MKARDYHRTLKIILNGLLVTVVTLCGAAKVFGQSLGTQVFRGQDLVDYGVMRPADIFRLLPDWSSYSIDGFTRKWSPNGLSDYSSSRWLLLVNYRPIETSPLEQLNLNLLPITVADIDSVVITHQPAMVGGFFADRGSIHIFTRTLRIGVDLGGSINSGNEVNDPGPFIYTPDRTPNIDRIGPDYSGYGQIAYQGFFAAASSLYREHHSTDVHIGYRTRQLHDNNNHSPRLMLWANEARIGHRNSQGLTEISVTRSTFDDFPFISRYGGEIPARQTYTSFFGTTRYDLGNDLSFSASVVMTEDHLHVRPNHLNWDPAIKLDYLRGRGNLAYRREGWEVFGGLGYDRFGARPYFYSLSSDHYSALRIQGGWTWTDAIQQFSFESEFSMLSGNLLPKFATNYQYRPQDNLRLHVHGSYSSHSVLEENSLLFWYTQGYGGFEHLGANPDGFSTLRAARQTTADLGLDLRISKELQLQINGGIRHHRHQWALVKNFEFDPENNRFNGPERLIPDIGGMRAVTGLRLSHQVGVLLDQSVGYHFNGELMGGQIFRELNRTTPRHSIMYRLRYLPVSSFSISARLNLQSATEWSSFYGTSAPFLGGPVVPTQINAGIYVRKSILDSRIYVTMGLDNVMNRALQQWPAGEVRDMIFEIQAGVRLRKIEERMPDLFERPFY